MPPYEAGVDNGTVYYIIIGIYYRHRLYTSAASGKKRALGK